MWNSMLVGAAAIAIASSSIVCAQQIEGQGERRQSPRVLQDDRTGLDGGRLDSHLASLRERLRLTPEQEKNWPAYEAALQALAKHRRDQLKAWSEQSRPTDPMQWMRRRADALSATSGALSRLADAQESLYNSFNEDQKRRFATLLQMPGDMHRWSRDRDDDRDRGSWRGRDDDGDRRGWRGRDDDDDRRGWRGRDDDDDRRGWRGRDDDDDRRGWRGRGDESDRRGWRGPNDDGDRRGWRDRGDDGYRHGWRGPSDDGGRRGWRGRGEDGDRRGWRGPSDGDRRGWRDWGNDGDRRGWRGRDDDDD